MGRRTLPRYPSHDFLQRVTKSGDFILSREMDSPFMVFLESLEHIVIAIREWQRKERDFGAILVKMVKVANKFLAVLAPRHRSARINL
jgi:hypothetical protein